MINFRLIFRRLNKFHSNFGLRLLFSAIVIWVERRAEKRALSLAGCCDEIHAERGWHGAILSYLAGLWDGIAGGFGGRPFRMDRYSNPFSGVTSYGLFAVS